MSTVTYRAHTCIDCSATVVHRFLTHEAAIKASRALGWQFRYDRRWLCPAHRTVPRYEQKARPTPTQQAPELGRLSQTFLERRLADDAEYTRRITAKQARERELAEAVFAQGRRPYTPAQAAAMDPNRVRIGLVGPVRDNARRARRISTTNTQQEQAS